MAPGLLPCPMSRRLAEHGQRLLNAVAPRLPLHCSLLHNALHHPVFVVMSLQHVHATIVFVVQWVEFRNMWANGQGIANACVDGRGQSCPCWWLKHALAMVGAIS
jgi:hypothetical protein